MPGDLEDPEQTFPFFYDHRYDKSENITQPGTFDMDGYIQSIAFETVGTQMSPKQLGLIKRELEEKGLLHQNPGEGTFRDSVIKFIKRCTMAKKVVHGRFK